MNNAITIQIEEQIFGGEIVSSKLRDRFIESFPLSGEMHRYGDEMYFLVDFKWEYSEKHKNVFEIGDLIYWKSNKSTKEAVAIFFGNTPVEDGLLPRSPSGAVRIAKFDLSGVNLNKLKTGDRGIISASK